VLVELANPESIEVVINVKDLLEEDREKDGIHELLGEET